jgi:hypothetical protein
MSRSAIWAALELLEAGETAAAVRILLDAVQEPPAGPRPFTCSCGLAFEWPGQLEAHQLASGHGRLPTRTRAA